MPDVRFAPITGAWIETGSRYRDRHTLASHLSQVRGLKPSRLKAFTVATTSHLSQVRGLKPYEYAVAGNLVDSHLSQVRGLKR